MVTFNVFFFNYPVFIYFGLNPKNWNKSVNRCLLFSSSKFARNQKINKTLKCVCAFFCASKTHKHTHIFQVISAIPSLCTNAVFSCTKFDSQFVHVQGPYISLMKRPNITWGYWPIISESTSTFFYDDDLDVAFEIRVCVRECFSVSTHNIHIPFELSRMH